MYVCVCMYVCGGACMHAAFTSTGYFNIQSTPDITNPKIPPILFFIKEVLYKQGHTIIHISGQCMNIITCALQYSSIHTVHIAKHNVTML